MDQLTVAADEGVRHRVVQGVRRPPFIKRSPVVFFGIGPVILVFHIGGSYCCFGFGPAIVLQFLANVVLYFGATWEQQNNV
jgi:hypothetical protein